MDDEIDGGGTCITWEDNLKSQTAKPVIPTKKLGLKYSQGMPSG
jgi:hypothetical protein